MPKLILLFFLLPIGVIGVAQKSYVCVFADTLTMAIPDSMFRNMSKMANQQDIELAPEMEQDLYLQLKASRMTMYQSRIVRGSKDQTIISIDPGSKTGKLTVTTFDSVLYKNDELFLQSATSSGFSSEPLRAAKREFVATGKKKSILSFRCDEYLSTDSTCYIWVTTELPDYINPGIRKGNVKGAVLGFDLKGQAYSTKCVLLKLGK